MIIIPMAGLSRRFSDAGYKLPKYMLPLGGRSVFARAVSSFSDLFDRDFLFVARDVQGTAAFIKEECDRLGIARARTVILDAPTAGQAETVELGIAKAGVGGDVPLTIFNIDTFRPGFRYPDASWFGRSAGYLEVFTGSGANWSYVEPAPGPEPLVLRTAEKQPISDLCCDGLYHFTRADDFLASLAEERRAVQSHELYVAPLYNHLISIGRAVHFHLVPREAVIFCGVPAEYEEARRFYEAPSLNKLSVLSRL